MEILIFKTNIETNKKVDLLMPVFLNNVDILDWNIDIEDIDNVLRVETNNNVKEHDIISLVKSEGFLCEVLSD